MSVPIYILAGQVNAGRPEMVASLTGFAADSGALLIDYSVAGSALSPLLDRGYGDWNAGGGEGEGELLADLQVQIDAILDPSSPSYIPDAYVAGVIWIHGENDISHPTATNSYGEDLIELRDHMVALYGEHEWIVAALSSDPLGNNSGSLASETNWGIVRDAQLALDSIDGFTVIDPDQVAVDQGLAITDIFIDGNLVYTTAFQTLMAAALADALPDAEGDATVVAGTSAMDWLMVEGGRFSYVLGGGGADTADFANLSHGINVRAGNGDAVEVTSRHGDSAFGADLIDVERVSGTSFDDYFETTEDLHVVLAAAGNDRVIGGAYDDRVFLGEGNDRAQGRDGDDFIRGNEGNDRIRGGDGDDELWGDEGNDLLQGGAGNDLLVGGAGDDRIDPNHGADVIVFRRGDSGVDRINGFNSREDVLMFSGSTLTADDFEFEVLGRDLHITVNGHGHAADITLINRGNIDPSDMDTMPDWLVF